MNRFKILLKDGTIAEAESKWLDISSIHNSLCDPLPFIYIGKTVVAKESIAMIQKIEEEKLETTEKEN